MILLTLGDQLDRIQRDLQLDDAQLAQAFGSSVGELDGLRHGRPRSSGFNTLASELYLLVTDPLSPHRAAAIAEMKRHIAAGGTFFSLLRLRMLFPL